MGKYVVLVTLALVLTTTLLANQGLQTDMDTSESQAARQEKVLARQIARSAYGLGLSELRRDVKNYRTEQRGVEYDSGTYDLTVSGPTSGPVTLRAVGHFGAEAYELVAEGIVDVNGFDGTSIDGPLSSVTGPGVGSDTLISGFDQGRGKDRHGMRVTDATAETQAEADLCTPSDDAVQGTGGTCDIIHEPLQHDSDALRQDIEDTPATHRESDLSGDATVGSESNPAVAKVDHNLILNGNVHGTGILYVEGDLKINGNLQWDGLILVADNSGGDGNLVEVSGSAEVSGSLMMHNISGEPGILNLGGSSEIRYNSRNIRLLRDILPTVDQNLRIEISNRDGKML